MNFTAAVRERYGSPKNLRIKDLSLRELRLNEILVKVHYTTVNRTDCSHLSGTPFVFRFFIGLRKPKLKITGTDFSGVIENIGDGVSNFQIGDRIFGFNDEGLGTHGNYCILSTEEALRKIPQGVSFESAAASLEAAHYAFNFLNKIKCKPGDKVLVNGGTGAIGSAAIQMLKAMNLEVSAVCGPKHSDRVRSLGAKTIFDYENEDFCQTDDRYDFIFDAVGKSSFKKCKPLLKSNGIYISSELGEHFENPILAITTHFINGKKVIFPIPVDIKKSMVTIIKLLEAGDFKPLIDRTYPLEDIAEAFRYVASGQKIGNVLIEMSH